MKTEISFLATSILQKPVIIVHKTDKSRTKKFVYKSDLFNHRFSVLDNKQTSNPLNWDPFWFANYE